MALANVKQFVCWKIQCLNIVGIYKIHVKEIDIKNPICNYYFIDEENYNDVVIYFTRYVHNTWKNMLRQHFYNLMGKLKNRKEKE